MPNFLDIPPECLDQIFHHLLYDNSHPLSLLQLSNVNRHLRNLTFQNHYWQQAYIVHFLSTPSSSKDYREKSDVLLKSKENMSGLFWKQSFLMAYYRSKHICPGCGKHTSDDARLSAVEAPQNGFRVLPICQMLSTKN